MEKISIKSRCDWCKGDPLYEIYHDLEWGVPVHDDQKLFEFLILESMQAGLSWITILRKRDNYRKALDQFNIQLIANYDEHKEQELMQNAGIIRNRLKIKSIAVNAKAFINIQKEHGSFSRFIWAYVGNMPIQNHISRIQDIPNNTRLSDNISKDLKALGFKFVGSTMVYAFMQATGMVNDHLQSCYRYDQV